MNSRSAWLEFRGCIGLHRDNGKENGNYFNGVV